MNYQLKYDPRALEDTKLILSQLSELDLKLAQKFRSTLAQLLDELDGHPERWKPMGLPIRRAQLKLTPGLWYYVDYRFSESEGEIHIIQIINQKANPNKWRS